MSNVKKTRTVGKYLPKNIEKKWQEKWQDDGLYRFRLDPKSEPYYTLVELPYPSGDLHIGHWFSFASPDAHARYKRMAGYNVFFPNGFDAFGLPAENAAIKRGVHPRDWTMSNISTMTKQFGTMGTMIDWSHEAITCLPEYYRWNQWIFIEMFKRGIAYRGKALSNWCPVDQTVLANEHVEDGKCWRCGAEVEQKEVAQWFLRITDFADRLIWPEPDVNGLSKGVDWPQSVREGQNNWIGRSEGAVITFELADNPGKIDVFSTRPDTLYGATFMVIAPEHKIATEIIEKKIDIDASVWDHVVAYVAEAKKKTERERKEEAREKTGVFSGVYAKHPVTSKKIPVWIADYVLATYGTGAIMAVPAHDPRDFAFAENFDLPIVQVIKSKKDSVLPYVGSGTLVNSGEWDGLFVPKEIGKTIDDLEARGVGKRKVQYHLRDWSISRQRYWGTPVPMIHCERCGIIPVPEKDLPVDLPYEVDYQPKGKPPLATASDWVTVDCPSCGGKAKRDTETLDTFFDSSWYFFRYVTPRDDMAPFGKELVEKIMPVDVYFGGAEHTLGHTLYARFFTKFFSDLGMINFEEFASKRVQHGVILGPDGYRMSKSRGNVINPDDVVKEYGADTVRLYLAFMMPFEATAAWNPNAISGVYRFLRRVWDLFNNQADVTPSTEDQLMMHKTIKKVGEDLDQIKFNTAVAALMEWLNHLSRKESVAPEEYKTLLLLLAPLAPHMTEELWSQLGEKGSIHLQSWPLYDERLLSTDNLVIVVQVNGKMRDALRLSGIDSKDQVSIEAKAKESEKVKRYLDGKVIRKVIFVPGRAINFVV
jgi:leucyl-tRNA synthetase